MIDELDSPNSTHAADSIPDRWGDAAAAGFTAVPNTLMRAQRYLGLTANDVVVALNILMHWWHSEHLPFPRADAIARRSGLGLRTVQRSLSALGKKGLIIRKRSGGRTFYDPSGLRTALTEFAENDPFMQLTLSKRTPALPTEKEAATEVHTS